MRLLLVAVLIAFVISGCRMEAMSGDESSSSRSSLHHESLRPSDLKRVSLVQTTAAAVENQNVPANTSKDNAKQKRVRRMTLAQLRSKYPSFLINRGSVQSKQVALTFDDVPDIRFTPKILDILKKHHVKATFFVVGYRAKAHPEFVRRIIREGHIVGNHSYNHALLTNLSMSSFQRQIENTDAIIRGLTGYTPRFVRPPYGEINEQQLKWIASTGRVVVNWNVDSLDWKGLNSMMVSKNILTTVGPGSIVLQHAGGGAGADLSGTIQALPYVIQKLKSQHMLLVTLPELLHLRKNK